MRVGWARARLGEIAPLVRRPVFTDAAKIYRQIGIRSFGKGVFHKSATTGLEIGSKRVFSIEPGDLLFNIVFAWEGAVAVASEGERGMIGSHRFLTCVVDKTRADARFLNYWFSRGEGRDQLLWASPGGAGRNRTLGIDKLSAVEVPLPPIDEQRRIVAHIDALAAKIAEARGLRDGAIHELTALRSSGQHHWFSEIGVSCSVGDVCLVIDPNPSHRYPPYVDNDVPMITTSDFGGDDEVHLNKAKHVTRAFFQETLGRFGVCHGDVIFARKGKIGYARFYPANVDLAMTHTLCVLKADRTRLEPSFLLHFARSAGFLGHLQGTMNPNLGVPTLGLSVIRDAPLPLPPVDEQRRIVTKLDALQAKLNAVKRVQAETSTELDALLPAILHRAFKGEL